jgi:hypothetical protein
MLPINFYQHHAENYLKTYIWKVSIEINDCSEIQNAQIILSIQSLIPYFFTR